MASTPYVTGATLAGYLSQTPDDSHQLYASLADGLVTDLIGSPPNPLPTRIKAIALEVAARGRRNADGYTSVTTSTDDTTKTWRRESKEAKAGVYLTDEERAELLGFISAAASSKPAGIGTIWVGVPCR